MIRRVYVRECKKCGGAHWFEVEIPEPTSLLVKEDRAFSRLLPCPKTRMLVVVNYVPYRPPARPVGNWL